MYYLGIENEAIDIFPVIQIVSRVMFTTSSYLQCITDGALKPGHLSGGIMSSHDGVLAGGFLTPSPTWISEYVYIWAPKCQTRRPSVVHRSRFIRNHLHPHPHPTHSYKSRLDPIRRLTFEFKRYFFQLPLILKVLLHLKFKKCDMNSFLFFCKLLLLN